MARQQRLDGPGTLHHVCNRGIARRTMFETRADKRLFLAAVARAVRRGEIRVHSFCLLTTHYHMLVESVAGRLDVAMQQIQTTYTRYFNRLRQRDGSLVRGRYLSKWVQDDRYHAAVIAYIARNPVQARLAKQPSDYEFCSAHPSWSGKNWLTFDPAFETRSISNEHIEVIEARMSGTLKLDPLDELKSFTPPAVLDWMQRKAQLADGTAVGLPLCHFKDVARAMEEVGAELWPELEGRNLKDISRVMRAGLLRRLCSISLKEIARQVERSVSTTSALIEKHEASVAKDEVYARAAAVMAQRALVCGPFGDATQPN